MRHHSRLLLQAGFIFAGLTLASLVYGAELKFGATINAEQAGTDSLATGSATLVLDTVDNSFDLTINLSGLSNELTNSHIHSGPADGNGPPIVPIGAMDAYTVIGDFYSIELLDVPFPPEELVNLLSGSTYLNFHTDIFGGGEIRGQLLYMAESSDALVNFSTRGMVNPGQGKAGLLIGGLVLNEPKTILFRMVSDSLTRFGVQTGLKDTSFEIYKLSEGQLEDAELIGENDNWKEGGQQYQIALTGFAPEFDNESGLIMNLEAGSYTLNADSEQGAGIALVETYGITPRSLGDTISTAANGELNQAFSLLNAALEATGLSAILNGPGPFTLFAPTDEAFLASFSQSELDDLLVKNDDESDADHDAELEAVTAILMRHVVGGKVLSTDLTEDVSVILPALSGAELIALATGGEINIENAKVIEGDLESTNGVIHVIDAVIADNPKSAGLGLRVAVENGATTITGALAAAASGDFHKSFTILYRLAGATEVGALLDGPGPYTLFAPTDAAFLAAFTPADLDELLAEDADQADDLAAVTEILKKHVVGSKILSTDVTPDVVTPLTTLNGVEEIEALLSAGVISIDSDGVFDEMSPMVIDGDIETDNGVTHVINAVIP